MAENGEGPPPPMAPAAPAPAPAYAEMAAAEASASASTAPPSGGSAAPLPAANAAGAPPAVTPVATAPPPLPVAQAAAAATAAQAAVPQAAAAAATQAATPVHPPQTPTPTPVPVPVPGLAPQTPATTPAPPSDPIAAAVAAAATAAAAGMATPHASAVATPTSSAPTPVPTKIITAVPLPEPERDPNVPNDRDAVVGEEGYRGTMLLKDLVHLHYFLWKKERQPQTTAAAKEDAAGAPASSEAPGEVVKAEAPSENGVDASAKATAETKPEPPATPPTKVVPPTEAKDVEQLAARLTELFTHGRRYELSGLKDVPTPFFKLDGRFFEKVPPPSTGMETDNAQRFKRLDENGARAYVSGLILKSFAELAARDNAEPEPPVGASEDLRDATGKREPAAICRSVDTLFANLGDGKPGDEAPADPRPYDVIFLPVQTPWEENMNYEHSSGNKNLLYLASQHVSVDTKRSLSRVKAAFALITAKIQVTSGSELVTKDQRFVILRNTGDKGQNQWENMDRNDLAEFAAIFVFEVYLEKRIYDETSLGNNVHAGTPVTPVSTQAAMKDLLSPSDANKPSDVPIPHPTTHDVLFGRGGMTNGHAGNRRFRDIIALHRPDYVRATKMDKPNVARKIVRAIRQGNPPGRFLRKGTDNMWRDVGDKIAAEKTSQGLRERSNAEKRQRSAMRESLRIGQRDSLGGESADGTPGGKKLKLDAAAIAMGMGGALNGNIVPITLSAKKSAGAKRKQKGINGTEDEASTESLPPNAVDRDGNIIVTDHGTFAKKGGKPQRDAIASTSVYQNFSHDGFAGGLLCIFFFFGKTVHLLDILCGRGGLTNHHKGNKRFRDIVALHRPDYVRAPKIQKPSVARVIVRAIRNGDPPGRFLKKDATTGKWFDIGDKKAAEKTSQALREKSDEEKEGKVPPGFTSPTLHIVPTATAAAAATNVDATLTDAAVQAAVAATQAKLGTDTGAEAAIAFAAAAKSEETKGEESKGGLAVKQEDVETANESHVEV